MRRPGVYRCQRVSVRRGDATGAELSVEKAKVKSQTPGALSLMPATFESTLSLDEFNALVAYLLETR